MKFPALPLAAAAIASSVLMTPAASGQTGETFTATASVKSQGVTAPVRIAIARFATDEERTSVNKALKSGGAAAVHAALAKMSDIGTLEVAGHSVPVKYAYARSTGSGRLVVVVTAEPVLHPGGGLPDARPKSGDDVAVAILVLEADNTGHGELAAAAQVRTNESGAIVIDHYDAPKIWLKWVARAK